MNENFEVCEVCGTKLVFSIDGNCCGAKCPKCNVFKNVTTYNNPAEEDKNIYCMYILKNTYSAKKAYALAKSICCDLNHAAELLNSENKVIFEGKAIDILRIYEVLTQNNINVTLPDFPYIEK